MFETFPCLQQSRCVVNKFNSPKVIDESAWLDSEQFFKIVFRCLDKDNVGAASTPAPPKDMSSYKVVSGFRFRDRDLPFRNVQLYSQKRFQIYIFPTLAWVRGLRGTHFSDDFWAVWNFHSNSKTRSASLLRRWAVWHCDRAAFS